MGNPEDKDIISSIKNGEIHKRLKHLSENMNSYLKEKYSFKKFIMIFMIIILGALSFSIYKINEVKTRGYAVYYGDTKVGIVREKEEAIKVLDDIKKNLSDTYDIDVVLDNELTFKDTHVKDKFLTSPGEIKHNIRSKLSFLVNGYALVVDGKEIGYSKSKEELEKLLEKLKEPYLNNNENSKLIDVSFAEDVKIENKEVPLNKIDDTEKLLENIKAGGEEVKTHIVEVGETLWTIAKMYDVTVDELIEANSDKDPEKLQIGDEIKLTVPKSLITVITVEEVEYTASTKYEVKVEYDKNMYKTQSKVKVEGQEGETKYLSRVTKHNGTVVKEDILKEEVIKEPVDELLVKGTKELPKTAATGAFLMPTRGRLTSRYGMRNGRMHYGLDIATSKGSPIKAADGGKVIYAGTKGSYGKLVEIDHGNGYVTRYAHCSSINVKVGQRVYKGQVIAKVGSTGRSTGSHLHFEVLKNGKNVNPASYVN